MQRVISTEKRTILVGFVDRSITRPPMASLTRSYRHNNNYKSSTWSRNIATSLAEEFHLKNISEWPMTEIGIHCIVYEVPEEMSVNEVLDALAKDKRVEIAQPMRVYDLQKTTISYKDPYYSLQINVQHLRLPEAHRLATGKNVKIALVDTGVEYNHPDLAGQISPDENFTGETSKEVSGDLHGTAVAGVIAAKANNGIGIVGVAPDAEVVAIKACWARNGDMLPSSCNTFTLALAINRAIKIGADILNLSLSGPPDPLVGLLIKAAIAKGIIVIAADPVQRSIDMRFPASMDRVIAAHMATDQSILKNSIPAPGVDVLTTVPKSTYDFISGCSLAAAHITGIVALLLELNPDLSSYDILKLLKATQRNTNTADELETIDPLAALSELGARDP